MGFRSQPGFRVEGDGLVGELAGGGRVGFVFGEEGEVVAGDAAVDGIGAAVVAGAEERFGFGELAAFGENGTEGALEGESAGGDLESFADAEFGEVIEIGFFVDERDTRELVEEGYFGGVGDEAADDGGAFVFEPAVVLKHDGVELFGSDALLDVGVVRKLRIAGSKLVEEKLERLFGGGRVVQVALESCVHPEEGEVVRMYREQASDGIESGGRIVGEKVALDVIEMV